MNCHDDIGLLTYGTLTLNPGVSCQRISHHRLDIIQQEVSIHLISQAKIAIHCVVEVH